MMDMEGDQRQKGSGWQRGGDWEGGLEDQTVKSLKAGRMSPSSLYPQGWHRFVSKASLAHSLHERRALASWVGQLPPSGFDFSPQFTVNPESLGFPLLIVNYLEVWESHPDVKGWGSMSEGLVSTCVMVNWF